MDGIILDDNQAIVVEIKSMAPATFNNLTDSASVKNHKYGYLQAYYWQIMLYMHAVDAKKGVLLAKNKVTGMYKEIWFEYNYDDIKTLFKKAIDIENHVKNSTLPAGVDNETYCDNCQFSHICLPPVDRKSLEFVDDVEIEEKLKRYFELKKSEKEYKDLSCELKKLFKEKEKLVYGDYLINGKWVDRKEVKCGENR